MGYLLDRRYYQLDHHPVADDIPLLYEDVG